MRAAIKLRSELGLVETDYPYWLSSGEQKRSEAMDCMYAGVRQGGERWTRADYSKEPEKADGY